MRVEPSDLREVICANPEMAPKDCSNGVATLEAMVSGLAPGKLDVTVIMGKSICGTGATCKKLSAGVPTAVMVKHDWVRASGRKINTLKFLTAAALLAHIDGAASSGQRKARPPAWCIE